MNNSLEAKILVVEDNEDDVFLLRRAFKKAGLNPVLHVVSDGRGAIDYLKSFASEQPQISAQIMPKLVLLDLQLPHFTGLQVLEWIRAQPAFSLLPVVMLTSSSSQMDIKKAYAARANAYIVKPSDVDQQHRMVQVLHSFWFEFSEFPFQEQKPNFFSAL